MLQFSVSRSSIDLIALRIFSLLQVEYTMSRLYTQRRSAPQHAWFEGGGTERPCFCYINERNYRVQRIMKKPWVTCANYWQRVLYMRVQPRGSDLKDFFPLFVCLFIYLFIIYFCHPHFPISIHHPQVSGPRFTDTPLDAVYSEQCFDARIAGWPNL